MGITNTGGRIAAIDELERLGIEPIGFHSSPPDVGRSNHGADGGGRADRTEFWI